MEQTQEAPYQQDKIIEEKSTKQLDESNVEISPGTVTFVYHPDELALKGKNRGKFEEILQNNIRTMMKQSGIENIKMFFVQQRYFATIPEQYESIAYDVSSHVFGISNFARCYTINRDMDLLCKESVEHFRNLLSTQEIPNFRVETSRVDKRFPIESPKISATVGGAIHDQLNIPVNLKDPHTTLHIEVLNKNFIFFSQRIPGAKGLPVRSSAKVACLLSGGFDSPVMVWMMMRRGCDVTLIHFHAAPFGGWRSSVSKVRKIVQQLHKWGGPTKFYSIAIGELQRQIAEKAPSQLRVTLYRRLMVRVAVAIGKTQHCEALATGDSLGQVASQTCESMTTIQSAITPTLIFRPLLGFTKEEIMRRAQEIGTKELSAIEGGDCCSHMLPKKVATKPSIQDAQEGEKDLNIDEMVQTAVKAAQIIDVTEEWNEDEADEAQDGACPLFSFEE